MYLCVCVFVTFLPDGAPDGDNKDTDDSENQKCQNTTYHSIWYCTVRLYHCTGIWKRTRKRNSMRRGGVWCRTCSKEIKKESSAGKKNLTKTGLDQKWKEENCRKKREKSEQEKSTLKHQRGWEYKERGRRTEKSISSTQLELSPFITSSLYRMPDSQNREKARKSWRNEESE